MNGIISSLSASTTATTLTAGVVIVGGAAAFRAYQVRGSSKNKSCCPPDSLPAMPEDTGRYSPRGQCFDLPPASGKEGCMNPLRVYVVAPPPAGGDGSSPNEKGDTTTKNQKTKKDWPKDKRCIILSPDMAGMDSGLHKKIADDFSKRLDAVVILYDPFDGKPFMIIPESDDGHPQQAGLNLFTVKFITALIWKVPSVVKANDWDTRIKPLFTDQLIPFIRENKLGRSSNMFSIMGFCYGCWVVFKASQDPEIAPHIECGISFHPSVEGVEKKAFGKDDIDLCRNCKVPQMVHATKSEPDSWKTEGEAHRALQSNPNVSDVQFQLAPPTESHGFMTRSDLSNKDSVSAIENGISLAVDFVMKHSGK